MERKKISIVASCYNEEPVISQFYSVTRRVLERITWDWELIFVNDGSSDRTGAILRRIAERDPKVVVVNFARNFGHEAAMIAGIDIAEGDGIIVMDSDLQNPPEMIPTLIEKFEDGYDVISMIRTDREDAGIIKRITSKLFYKILNLMSPIRFEENSSDFFAINRQVADVLRTEYRDKIRYLRGFVQAVGFNRTTIEYRAVKRAAGESHYSIRKLIKFSITTLCGFSDMPLKLGIYSGLLAAVLGVILIIYSIIRKIVSGAPSGYTTIIVVLCFLFALVLVVIGIIGEYISILLTEVKDRPIYIVRDVIGRKPKRPIERYLDKR